MHKAFADSHAEYVAWLDGIKRTHQRKLVVRVLDLDHRRLNTIGMHRLLDANVTIDVTRDVTRMLELSLLDPTRSIAWEPDTESAQSLHMHRMLQVLDGRYINGTGWVYCPVFTGPIMDVDREGATVQITCDGKERLALGEFGVLKTWAQGTLIVDVIRDMLNMAGETSGRIHLPALRSTLPDKLSVARMDQIWAQVKKLAHSVDRVIFYDARGHVQMRRAPTSPGMTINRASLCGPARVNRTMPDLKNRWLVQGAKPKGSKVRVTADISLPRRHRYSAQTLGRKVNGVIKPRWHIRKVENTAIKTQKKANEIAGRMRDEQQLLQQELTFECLPFPHVEEHDLIRVVDPATGARNVRVRTVTLPLVAGPMQVGLLKRTAAVRPRRRG